MQCDRKGAKEYFLWNFSAKLFLATPYKVSVFQVILVCIFPRVFAYSVRMRENAGKMRNRITPNTDTFYVVCIISVKVGDGDVHAQMKIAHFSRTDWIFSWSFGFVNNTFLRNLLAPQISKSEVSAHPQTATSQFNL